ncbi:hypothetical protein LA52FAK_01510 [Desulforhopalus sp. 52FAK]
MVTIARTTVDSMVADRLHLSSSYTRKELEDTQMSLVRKTVSYARNNSSLYGKRFANTDVNSFKTIGDLEHLPFLTAKDVIDHGHLLHCVSQSQVARIITMHTSGSTGKPKRYSFTAADLAATSEFFLRGMASLVTETDRVLVLMPFETEASVGELLIGALSRGGIFAKGFWPPPEAVMTSGLIAKEKITCVVGLPQHLLALSEVVPHGKLRSMLLASDYAPKSLRDRIEENCGCETFLHYGATESGLGGAVECGEHCGLHIRESDLLLEIIDRKTGRQVADGEVGEVVFTTLGREAMPLIRYRTGDFAYLDRSKCNCGGVTARLCAIRGRLNECRLADGSLLHHQSLDDILFQVPGLLDYRATLDHKGVDRLSIEYMSSAHHRSIADTMHQLISTISEISGAEAMGMLHVDNFTHVKRFAPSHTLKRTILDLR